jgi:hypothetical protein
MIPIIGELIGKVIDRVIPDPAQRDAMKLQFQQLEQAGEFKQLEADLAANLAQTEINKIEAASPSLFKSGWRPAVGWVCVAGVGYTFLARPIVTFVSSLFGGPAAPPIDTSELMALLLTLLGVGGMRMWEKFKGVASS